MAEPVALQVKPPQVMTLGDMVNIARGAQAYQQAEQVNPLVLQQQQQAARTGQIDLGVKEQGDLERKNIQTFMSNPKNWQNETGDVDINKINAEVTRIAPLTGRDQIEKLTTLAKSQTENTKAAQDLTQSERAIIAGPIGILARNKVQDKKVYIQELDNIQKYHPDNKRLHKLIETQKGLINQLPEGADLATAGIRVSESLLTPTEARTAFTPTSTTTASGQVVTTKPSISNQAPEVTYSTPQGVTPMPNIVVVNGAQYEISPPTTAGGQPILKPLGGGMTQQQGGTQQNVVPPPSGGQPQGVTPIQMSLPYPVRRAGDVRPYAPSEKYDEEKGQAYRDTLANEARNLITYRRSTDEVIREAEKIGKEEWNEGAGFIGKMGRNFSTFLGTEQGVAYKNLSKALANVQMNSMKALGLSTDADKTLSAAANGDYTYPPEVLKKIAGQAHGNMTNIELQTKGAQAFAKKYGDSNQQVFQDLWNSNSKDTRVFEAIAINDSNIPQKEKIKRIDKLLEDMSPTEIDALTKSKNRLLKLSKTGEL